MPPDITNRFIASILSFEFLAAGILVAVAWGATTAKMEALAQDQVQQENRHTERLLRMEETVRSRGVKIGDIERDVAVMKNDVHYIKKNTEKVEKQVEQILHILQRQESREPN